MARWAVELAPDQQHVRVIHAYVNAVAGHREAAERSLEQIPEQDPLLHAAIWTNLGETDRAFALLERAVGRPGDSTSDWDVFELSGRFVTTVSFPVGFRPTDVGEDYVIGVHTDAWGVERVCVYPLHRDRT